MNFLMGASVEGDVDGTRSIKNDNPHEIGASNPVVYQLVRVNGDGMLIPATDDELIEVEHYVDADSKLPYTHCVKLPELGISGEKDDVAYVAEGTRQSDSVKVVSKEFVCKEQMDIDCPSFMQPNLSDTYTKRQSTETCSEPGNNEVNEVAEEFVSETYSNPDFSLLKGEIFLDNFSIRELQEAFRATFGRYTSVKDKLWLKRRIAMGLTNSCDVPSTNFIIKDNKIVHSNVEEETKSRTQSNPSDPGLITTNKTTALLNETLEEAMADTGSRIEGQQISSSKGEKSLKGCNEDNVNTQIEQCGAKRLRKPTKRYIEELSEVEATECSGRLASLSKISIQDQRSLTARIRTTSMFDTSQDLLGGYEARIPCVLRVRRRRPRKNFLALVNFVQMDGEKRDPEALNDEQLSEEQHEKFISSECASFRENSDTVQTMVASVRRKHHRAWTLGEVLKLVEGVAKYGAGRWSQIRQVAFASCSHRTSVDLKDKWRNLLKASFAQVTTDKGIGSSRKPTSLPIPTPILLRVRELAEKHSESGIEFGSSQFVGHGAIIQEKETGFL